MNEQINRLTNIKAIGWTTLTTFGALTLWIIFEFVGTVVFDHSVNNMYAGQEEFNEAAAEMKGAINQMRAILLIAGGLTFLTTIGAFGLIRLKNWGLVLYQSMTIVIILALLAGLAYYIYNTKTEMSLLPNSELDMEMHANFRASQNYKTIGYGVFALLFSWALTRVTIFLSKRATRIEFH